jgi:hypothetical protein
MLEDNDLCVPLATLVLPLGEVSQFISSISSAKRSKNQIAPELIAQFVERIKGALTDFETIKCAKSKLDPTLRDAFNKPPKKIEVEPDWISSIRAENEGIIFQWIDSGTYFIVGRHPNEEISFISPKVALRDKEAFLSELDKQFHQRANDAAF